MARPKFDRKMILSLDEETYQVLMELGEVSDKPAAAMVREILQGALPQLRQTIKMLRQIKQGALTEAIETGFKSSADAQMELFKAQGEFLDSAQEAREKRSKKK